MPNPIECSECRMGCWDPKVSSPYPAPCTVNGNTPALRGYPTMEDREEIKSLVNEMSHPDGCLSSRMASIILRLDALGWSPF